MLGRRVAPERRAQLARQALKEIAAFRARLVLRELQAPLGLLDLLAFKVCRAWLGRWERREQQVLRDHRG